MSSYEDYSRVALDYDDTRSAVGIEIIRGCLAGSAVPLGRQRLLDAGCGTGNYSRAMIQDVGHIAAVDMNSGMLNKARLKFDARHAGRIAFHRASIAALPFDGSVFDGVMVNQVLHHLADDAAGGYPVTRKVLAEFARVLKPGGSLVINICSHAQLRRGFWYCALIQEEAALMCDRHVPLPMLRTLLEDSGFARVGRTVPVDAAMQGRAYLESRGPLDPGWRRGDSVWSTVSADRLEAVCERVRRLDRAGRLDAFVREHDAPRDDIGQMTFVHAVRA